MRFILNQKCLSSSCAMLGNCALFWTSNCSLRTHQIRWAWLLGPDSWPDRSLSWSAGSVVTHWCMHPTLHFAYGIQCSCALWISDYMQFLFAAQVLPMLMTSIGRRGRTLLSRITCWRLWVKVLKVARGYRRLHNVWLKKVMATVQNSQNGLPG